MTALEQFVSKDILNPAALPGAVFYALVVAVLAAIVARLLRLTAAQALKRDHKRRIDRTVVAFLTQLVQLGVNNLIVTLSSTPNCLSVSRQITPYSGI